MHVPDQELVAECARLVEQLTALQQENGDLRARVEEVTDRAAHSRDAVVRIRERLRAVREERRALKDELAADRVRFEREKIYAEGFVDGMERSATATLVTVTDRLEQQAQHIGAASALVELEQKLAQREAVLTSDKS